MLRPATVFAGSTTTAIPSIATIFSTAPASFSESFNIVSADFVASGIPVVVSQDITWMPFLFRANPTNTESIINKISVMRFFPRFTKWLNKLALFIYNYLNSYYWEQFFGKVK